MRSLKQLNFPSCAKKQIQVNSSVMPSIQQAGQRLQLELIHEKIECLVNLKNNWLHWLLTFRSGVFVIVLLDHLWVSMLMWMRCRSNRVTLLWIFDFEERSMQMLLLMRSTDDLHGIWIAVQIIYIGDNSVDSERSVFTISMSVKSLFHLRVFFVLISIIIRMQVLFKDKSLLIASAWMSLDRVGLEGRTWKWEFLHISWNILREVNGSFVFWKIAEERPFINAFESTSSEQFRTIRWEANAVYLGNMA